MEMNYGSSSLADFDSVNEWELFFSVWYRENLRVQQVTQ